jgi:RND family efflux transporter MFP subunit
LARVSAREITARLEQARALSTQATRERDRAVALQQQGVLPLAAYEAAVTEWNVARARQEEAATVAASTVLRAPFAGVIKAKLVSAGDTALPGQPLFVLQGLGDFRFEARVPESIGRELRAGERVPIHLDDARHKLEGTITEIQPALDDSTRTQLVKLELPNTQAPSAGLRSGQFGRALFTTGQDFVLTVPSAAVSRRGQLETVFVVDAGVARLRLVRTGRERQGRVEILAGLTGGEQVARGTNSSLVDGERLEPRPQVEAVP